MQKIFFSFLLSTTFVFAGEKFDPPSLSHPLSTLSSQETSLREADDSTSLSSAPPAKKQKREEYLLLGEDELAHIASFLRVADGIRMSHTCKRWDEALNSSPIWDFYAKRLPGYFFFQRNPLAQAVFPETEGKLLLKRLLTSWTIDNVFPEVRFTHMSKDFTVMVGTENIYGYVMEEKIDITDMQIIPAMGMKPCQLITHSTKKQVLTRKVINIRPVVWRQGQAYFEYLPILNEKYFAYKPTGISGDGKVIIGTMEKSNNEKGYTVAVKWTNEGIQRLDSPRPQLCTHASAISEDGKVIIGRSLHKGIIWKSGKPFFLTIPYNYTSNSFVFPKALNADGTVIVGYIEEKDGREGYPISPVKWDNNIAATLLPQMFSIDDPSTNELAKATTINASGTVIGGYTDVSNPEASYFTRYSPAKWTNEGIQSIGWRGSREFGNGEKTGVLGISTDGNIIMAEYFLLGSHETPEDKIQEHYLLFTTDHDTPPLILLKTNGDRLTKIKNPNLEEIVFLATRFDRITEDILENFIYFTPRIDLLKKEGLKSLTPSESEDEV